MRLLHWLLWSCVAVAATHANAVAKREATTSRVVCYYTNWSVYRPGTAKFSPQNINPYLCTHLIYAFGGLSRENGLRPYDKYQDIEQGGYAKFTGLKTYNKQLKTMLAIGGWNEGSARFSSLVADQERRAEFVKNVVRFLRQNHFDGLDLDWEYPAFRDGGKPRDRDNYALLVQELREEFDREHSKTRRPRLLLTMAVPAGIEYIDKGYDVPKLNRYLDFMNILSYDYHSAFEPSVNHHSPLYPMEEDNEYNFDTQLCIDYTVKHLIELGADRDKLVVGIPTYGRSYTLFNPDATDIGAPADGPGEQGDATREKGYLAYYEICENLEKNDWEVVKPNPSAMGPYAYKGNQWVGYDDEDIVRLKAKYVSENGLGGIMFWAIDNDDFRGKCHGRPYPLIEAGKEAMFTSDGLTNEVSGGSGQTRKGSQRPRTSSGGRSGGRKRKNKSRSTTTSSTTTRRTTTASTTTPKYVTPEPPTTPDPGSDFKCKDEGFFPHPRDCKKYFWCLDSGPSNLGIVAHQFTCPSGLVFNKAADSCDYARNVICKTKAKAETTTTKPPTTTTSRPTSRTTRPTTTTTTTTTTPPPEEEYEEYEDEDEDEEAAPEGDEEDPKVIQELIKLIKKLGGIEQLERQLQQQEKTSLGGAGGISRSLYNKVLARTNSGSGRGAVLHSTATSSPQEPTTRYTSIFRNRPIGPQNEGLEEPPTKFERPKYVTIQRNRPSTTAPVAEEDEDLDDDDYELDDDEEEEEEKPEIAKPATTRTSGREYVNIRRERPQRPEETDGTTPKYTTIQRNKPTPEELDEPVDQEAPDATAVSPDKDKSDNEDELPESRQDTALENPPKENPSTKRPSRLNIISKKGRKETEIVPVVEKETEAPVVKVSAGRQYIDAASIRSGPRTSFDLGENGDITTPLPLTNEALPTTTHKQFSEVTVDQVSDIPLLNKYLDVTRFRSTTGKSSVYLDDQRLPSISPLPSEYTANSGDEQEANLVVARSPAPVSSQSDYAFTRSSTSLPLTTTIRSNADAELQEHDITPESLNNDSLDSITISIRPPTEATFLKRRNTTLPTTALPLSTTPLTKVLSRHSFSPRRRSTTVATTAATVQVSLSTSEYFRDIPLSSTRKSVRPQYHFFPKLRRNSTVVAVNANDILTPSPVTTQSSVFTQHPQQENITRTANHESFGTLAEHEDYSNVYLTTTETQLDNVYNNEKEFEDGILKPTSWVLGSESTNTSYPEKSTSDKNSFALSPDSDYVPPTVWYETNKEQNIITDEPKLSHDIIYAPVTDYTGPSPTAFLENVKQSNSTTAEQISSKYNINSLVQPNDIPPTSWSEKDSVPDDITQKEQLTSSDENLSNSREGEFLQNIEQPLIDKQINHLKDIQSTTTTTMAAPTEFDFSSETTPATVIETVPPPTTTRFTPTVTRVVTSVTESGTTERQRIAVNRVPYSSLIAALRAKQFTPPDNADQSEITTFATYITDNITDINMAPATTPEPSTSRQRFRYITTAEVFSGPPEPKKEKIMEVNRIVTVTAKQDSQTFLTRYFTKEQTTIHTDIQGVDTATIQTTTGDNIKHGKNDPDYSSESLFGFDNTVLTTPETEILPTTESNQIENNDNLKNEASITDVETDGEALINVTYSGIINNTDITPDLSTEASSTTTSTIPVSTFVERARTRSPGFRRKTTEKSYISNDRQTPSSPVNGFRKAVRSRNRQYKPSTTVVPKETEDPLLAKLRKANRPLNTSRSDGNTARKPGSFSRRRIYRLSSTTESAITAEFNTTDDKFDSIDGVQKSYTRGRIYRLPSKSTTEKILPKIVTTDENYSGKDSNSSVEISVGDNIQPVELTTAIINHEEFSTNSTYSNENKQTSKQRISEGGINNSSQEDTDNISSQKSVQENYYSADSTPDSIKTTTKSFNFDILNNSNSSDETEHLTSTHVTLSTNNIFIEPNNLSTTESVEVISSDSTVATKDVSAESSTEETRIKDANMSFTTVTEETHSSSNPLLTTEISYHEPKILKFKRPFTPVTEEIVSSSNSPIRNENNSYEPKIRNFKRPFTTVTEEIISRSDPPITTENNSQETKTRNFKRPFTTVTEETVSSSNPPLTIEKVSYEPKTQTFKRPSTTITEKTFSSSYLPITTENDYRSNPPITTENYFRSNPPITTENDFRSNPPITTESGYHEPKIRNFSLVPATNKNEFANENEPTARPQRRKMVVKKRRRRPTGEAPTGVGGNKENEVNQVIRNYKDDKDVIHEKGESLAALEDTNRNFISTESSLSAEFYTTADDNGDHYVKLSILNKLNHDLPGHVPVTGSDYIESSDYSDYDKYSSRENYDSKTTANPVDRYTSRFVYSSGENSNQVQDENRVPSELSAEELPSRETPSRLSTVARAEVTDTPYRQGGRGSSRFRTNEKAAGKSQDVTRRRKVVRKKRPNAVAGTEVTDEEASAVNITARPLGRGRQPGTLFSSRQRQRATTTTPPPTTAAPSTRQPAAPQRRVVKRRKFGPRGQSTTEAATETPQLQVARVRTTTTEAARGEAAGRKFAFPKRRVSAAGNDSSTAPTPPSDAQVQPSAVVEDTQDPAGEATALPDLAHPAVAAIARLATHPPPQEEPAAVTMTTPEGEASGEETPTEASSSELPEAATTRAPKPASPASSARQARIPPARRLASKSTTTTTAATPSTGAPLRRQPLKPRPFTRITSPAPRAQPSAAPAAPRPPPPPTDYDYYDDASIAEAAAGPGGSKVKVHDDGYIECLDQGNFPHPYSCKKFISCAKMESGGLLGWEYTCPRQLSFDPVGGICNWSAGLGCKE